MKKEEWVNSILESASEIKEVEPNPFLYPKIFNRLNSQRRKGTPEVRLRLRWTAAFVLIIAINVSAFVIYRSKIQKQQEAATVEALTNEMISCVTYNY